MPTNQEISRRRFLKQTAFGAFALATAGFIPVSDGAGELDPMIAKQLKFFSPKEYLIMHAVADRMVGRSNDDTAYASNVDVALRADNFLAGADEEIQEQFHQLLTVFNAPVFTFLFDFRFSSFIAMSPETQDSYIEDWMTSGLGFRRTAFQALKRTSLSMFYTEPHSWADIGFEGMDVPHE